MKSCLIPNQLYQIIFSFLKHLFCKTAKNTQAEQRKVHAFLVALIRYQIWRKNGVPKIVAFRTKKEVFGMDILLKLNLFYALFRF